MIIHARLGAGVIKLKPCKERQSSLAGDAAATKRSPWGARRTVIVSGAQGASFAATALPSSPPRACGNTRKPGHCAGDKFNEMCIIYGRQRGAVRRDFSSTFVIIHRFVAPVRWGDHCRWAGDLWSFLRSNPRTLHTMGWWFVRMARNRCCVFD